MSTGVTWKPEGGELVPGAAASGGAAVPAAAVAGGSAAAATAGTLRLGVVTPIPTPYRDPFWNVLSGTPGVDLTVYYCAAGKPDRPWKATWKNEFTAEVLPGRNLLSWRGADQSCYWNPGILGRLRQGRFDALLISGYNHFTLLVTILWAVWTRTPYFLMCESHLRSARSGWVKRLKRPFVEWVIRHAAGCVPTGQLAADYVAHYGAAPDRLLFCPNIPDVGLIESEMIRLRAGAESPVPESLRGRPLILFVGRLIPKKRAELLIRAFHSIQGENNAGLVIIGDGPLRPALEALVRDLQLVDRVHFAGFVQPEQVWSWYARAHVFVLPSSETWGVVVIEALAAGLQLIVSDEVGCHPDVVVDGALGEVVPARDERALVEALRRQLHASTARGDDYRAARDATLSRFRYDWVARTMHDAIRRCLTTPEERPESAPQERN